MASSVTQYSNIIDINFPAVGESVAGAAKFHKNFNLIQQSFDTITSEYNLLEKKLINLERDNNFGNKTIKNVIFTNTNYKVYDLGLLDSGIIDIDYAQGHYQKCLVNSGYFTFNIINWPVINSKGQLRLEVKNNNQLDNSTCRIYFSGNIQYVNNNNQIFTLPATEPCFFDIWSVDNGSSIYVKPLGISSGSASTSTYSSGGGSSGPAPSITSISPPSAGSSGGYIMTIDGANFTANPQIRINGTQIPVIYSTSTTQIVFYSIAGMGGVYQTVSVTTVNGTTSTAYWIYDDSSGI